MRKSVQPKVKWREEVVSGGWCTKHPKALASQTCNSPTVGREGGERKEEKVCAHATSAGQTNAKHAIYEIAPALAHKQ